MKIGDHLTLTEEDNMGLMARYKPNHFDLAIVDPPFGIDVVKKYKAKRVHDAKIWRGLGENRDTGSDWDLKPPTAEYFKELKRVSKHQITMGGNYFGLKGGYLFIHKQCEGSLPSNSDGDLAHLSMYTKNFYCFLKAPRYWGALEHMNPKKIHMTQKRVELYEYLLRTFAKKGDKILDTHLGSGSIAVACHRLGFNLTACEIDKIMFERMIKRVKLETIQKVLAL